MNIHSDYNYFVDKSLFGSSTRTQSTNNRFIHKQIFFEGKPDCSFDEVKRVLSMAGVTLDQDHFIISNIQGGCVVKFKSTEIAEEVMTKVSKYLNHSVLPISVKWYEPKDDRNVYATNLPIEFTEEELKDLFKEYGSILSVKIMKKDMNKNAIGFIRYQNKSEAQEAIKEMNLKKLNLIGSERFVHCDLSKMHNSGGNEKTSFAQPNHEIKANTTYNLCNQDCFHFQPSQQYLNPIQQAQYLPSINDNIRFAPGFYNPTLPQDLSQNYVNITGFYNPFYPCNQNNT